MLTMSGSSVISKEKCSLDSGKYVRYTNEQVEALERLYNECPKPSSLRRQQLIRECPILQNIEPKQIKVWFQNRRCREKQRKEYARLQAVNGKLTAMNKLLMEENDRLQKQLAQLHYENNYLRQQGGIATTDTSCDSVVTSGLQHVNATPQHPAIDVTHSGILSLAEEALTEFLAKATGTAVEWVQMPGMKPGPDSAGMVNIAHGCNAGVAARAGGMVALEPTRVAGILKDRASWCRDCRRSSTLWAAPAGNGGTLEILYMQMYAPTTMAPARDFCTLRYSSSLEDGGYVICERSLLGGLHPGVPTAPPMPSFARAEMRSSGCLIRPCGAGGSVVIIVDHFDLEPWTVPEIVRPLYESSAVLAEKMSLAAFRHLSCIAQESSIDLPGGGVVNQQPAAVRSLSHRLARGFNDAINTFVDEGWTPVNNADHDHGLDDVQVLLKPSSGVVCAKASMPLQAVSPSLLVRFLREHRSEWADHKPDPNSTYSSANLAASMRPFTQYTGSADFSCTSQLLYPQVHSVNQDELLELIKLEDCNDVGREDSLLSRETLLLQHCSGLDEKAAGPACAQMVFGPIDTNSVSDEVPLLPSGFRVVRLDRGGNEGEARTRTLDLASALEVGPAINGRQLVLMDGSCGNGSAAGAAQYQHHQYSANAAARSLLTLVFQFPVENRLQQDALVPLARQFVRHVMANVRRIVTNMAALLHHQALPAPLSLPPAAAASPAPASSSEITAQGLTLGHLICKSYKRFVGMDLVRVNAKDDEDDDDGKQCFEQLWQFSDAVMCCSCKTMPMFTFANQAGLDMLETTPAALYELSWEETLDEEGKKSLGSTLAQVLQQGYACLPAGVRLSSTGRLASYDRAIAWKVLDVNDDTVHGVAFVYLNWSFM